MGLVLPRLANSPLLTRTLLLFKWPDGESVQIPSCEYPEVPMRTTMLIILALAGQVAPM